MKSAEVSRLYQLVCRMRDLLLNEEEWEWAAWMDRSAASTEQHDTDAINRLLSAFDSIDWSYDAIADPLQEPHIVSCIPDGANGETVALLGEVHIVARQLRKISGEPTAIRHASSSMRAGQLH